MKTVCCKCQRTKRGSRWIKKTNYGEKLSHGYCPECFKEAMKNAQTYVLNLAVRLAAP